jgi:hypothetical protein
MFYNKLTGRKSFGFELIIESRPPNVDINPTCYVTWRCVNQENTRE